MHERPAAKKKMEDWTMRRKEWSASIDTATAWRRCRRTGAELIGNRLGLALDNDDELFQH